METVLAVDIGGTKLAAGQVDAAGRLLARAVRATPEKGDAEGLLALVLDAVAEVPAARLCRP
jgi:glucokinase